MILIEFEFDGMTLSCVASRWWELYFACGYMKGIMLIYRMCGGVTGKQVARFGAHSSVKSNKLSYQRLNVVNYVKTVYRRDFCDQIILGKLYMLIQETVFI